MNDAPSPRRRRRIDPLELGAVVLLVVAVLTLHLPALDRVGLNPDESQYEATAAYLVASGTSAFALPYGVPGTFTLYKTVARVFGPYSMLQVRVLVMLIVMATSWMLYRIVAGETARLPGLLAGLLFVHHSVFFEGWSANREWFAGLVLVLGVYLFTISRRHRSWRRALWIAAAGFAAGAALWFKLQAAYLVLVVPLVILLRCAARREWGEGLRRLVAFGIGGALSALSYLLPFLAAGTLGGYLRSIVGDWKTYVQGNAAVTVAPPGLAGWWEHFYFGVEGRPLLLFAYGTAALFGVAFVVRARGGGNSPRSLDNPLGLLFAVYLLAAVLAVKMGERFFSHYYLLLTPPVAALCGFGLHLLTRREPRLGAYRWPAVGLVVLLALDRSSQWVGHGLRSLAAAGPFPGAMLAYFLMAAIIVAYGLTRSTRRSVTIVAGALLLEAGLLIAQAQSLQVPRSLPHDPDGYPALTAYLERHRRPDDRLFVWGWSPEIYSLVRMEPASHFTVTQYIVEDYLAEPEPRLNRPLADLLMADLERRPPRFIVDAARRSWTMAASADPWIYRLELYPEFELGDYLERYYDRVATVDRCDVYRRREPETVRP